MVHQYPPPLPTKVLIVLYLKENSSILRQPFLEDGYKSNLTEKFVMINVKMLKWFNSCTLAYGDFTDFSDSIIIVQFDISWVSILLLYA